MSHTRRQVLSELPSPQAYYRPTHARELREKADRLERGWLQVLGVSACVVAALTTQGGCTLLTAVAPQVREGWLSSVAGLGMLGASVGVISLVASLQRRIRADRSTAAALEEEHRARSGALQPGEDPDHR